MAHDDVMDIPVRAAPSETSTAMTGRAVRDDHTVVYRYRNEAGPNE